jgi:hypothetical protein
VADEDTVEASHKFIHMNLDGTETIISISSNAFDPAKDVNVSEMPTHPEARGERTHPSVGNVNVIVISISGAIVLIFLFLLILFIWKIKYNQR